VTAQLPSPATLAPEQALIIVNCSRSKLITSSAVPALELYQGGCVPQVREHFAGDAARRSRIRILSAAHGLLRPGDPVSTYDRRLRSNAEAIQLHQRTVGHQIDAEFAVSPGVRHLLVIVEPLYLLALRRVFDHLDRLAAVSLLPDARAWSEGLVVLRQWGWA
jgi:hypothetical protein